MVPFCFMSAIDYTIYNFGNALCSLSFHLESFTYYLYASFPYQVSFSPGIVMK